jgi:hypothetical protein
MIMNIKGEWVFRVIIGALLGLLCWFARSTWEEQKEFNRKMDDRVKLLELKSAEQTADRFTFRDWDKGRQVLDAQMVQQDKRLTRAEDAQAVIEKTLIRIENKIDGLTK